MLLEARKREVRTIALCSLMDTEGREGLNSVMLSLRMSSGRHRSVIWHLLCKSVGAPKAIELDDFHVWVSSCPSCAELLTEDGFESRSGKKCEMCTDCDLVAAHEYCQVLPREPQFSVVPCPYWHHGGMCSLQVNGELRSGGRSSKPMEYD